MAHALKALADKFKIALNKPFSDLSPKAQNTLIEGAGSMPGVLGILERFYREENSSETYQEWFMGYMSPATCAAVRRASVSSPPASRCACTARPSASSPKCPCSALSPP
jgi:excinuclease UvrABC ATPase subunit